MFKVIQRIMGDREREGRTAARMQTESLGSITNGSTHTLVGSAVGLLEEERWLLGEGLTHGELRDEIYCQLMKQLSGNPNPWVYHSFCMCLSLMKFSPVRASLKVGKCYACFWLHSLLQRILKHICGHSCNSTRHIKKAE